MATNNNHNTIFAQGHYQQNIEQIFNFLATFSKINQTITINKYETQMFSGLLSKTIIGEEARKDLRRMNKNLSQFNALLSQNLDEKGNLRIKHEVDSESVKAVKGAIEESGEKVTQTFIDKVRSFLPTIGPIQKWTTPAAIILGTIALIKFFRDKTLCRTTIYVIIALFVPGTLSFIKPYIYDLLKNLINVIKDDDSPTEEVGSISNQETFYTQMFMGAEITQEGVWTIASALAGIVLAWAVRDPSIVKSVVKSVINFKDFERVRSGVMSFMEFIIEVLEKVINSIRTYFGNDSVFFLKNGYSEVYTLYNKVERVLSEAKNEENLSTITIDKATVLEALINEAEKDTSISNRRESKLINQMKSLIKPLIERIRKLNRGKSGSRIAPTTVLLIGESQIGKSVASMQFIKGIIAATIPESRLPGFQANPDSEIYSKPESSPYWEGYHSQWSQVYDDIGHMLTIPGKESVESDFISIKNSVPMPLNMAFGDKGSKYYDSRLVIASSNTEYWEPKNLTYKDAFINRWDFVYITAVKADSKYCINPEETHPMKRVLKPNLRFDNSKNTPHLEYIRFDFKKRHQIGPKNKSHCHSFEDCCSGSLTMEQVIHEVSMYHRESETKYEEIIGTHQRIIDEQLILRSKGKNPSGNSSEYESSEDFEVQGTKCCTQEEEAMKISMPSVQLLTGELMNYGESQGDNVIFRLKQVKDGDFVPSDFLFHKHFKACCSLRLNTNMVTDEDVTRYVDLIDRAPINNAFGVCPVMDTKSSCVVVPYTATTNDKSKFNYIMGAVTANVISLDDAKNVIMKFDVHSKAYYPSPYNNEFINYCRESNIDWQCIGLFVHCVARVKANMNMCYIVCVKKSLKKTIYSALAIVRDNFKMLLDPDWIASMGGSLLQGMSMVSLAFASLTGVMQVVKHTIGMDKFVSMTGIPEYNSAAIKSMMGSIDPIKSDNVQSTNLSIVKNYQKSRNTARHKIMTSQFAADSTMHDMVDSFVKRNCYLIYISGEMHGAMWIVAGRVGIMPKHYRSHFDDLIKRGKLTKENPVVLRSWESNREEPYSWFPQPEQFSMPLKQWATSDIVAVVFDRNFQPRPNRINFFISEKDLDSIIEERKLGRITVVPKVGEKEIRDVPINLVDGRHKNVVGGYQTPYFWAYEGYTKHGDCGAVLSVHDRAKSTPGKIMGMHIAGNGTNSLAMPIMKEDLEELIDSLGVKYTTEEDERTCYDTQGKKNRSPHPALWAEEQIPMPKYSKICRSPLYGCIEPPTKVPAKLSAWKRGEELVDPIAIALAKQIPRSVIINEKLVDIITHEYYKFIMENAIVKRSGTGKIYSIEEACAGVKGDPYVKGLPRKSSAGHPYNLMAKNHGGGKKLWFGTKEDYDLSGDFFNKFKMRVEGIIESAKHGRRMNHVTLDFPKDETLPTRKVEEEGKVRLVMGSPMDHTVTGRCLTLEFMKFMLQNAIHNWSGVGIDPHDSSQWGLIAEKLRSGYIIEADQSAYDGRMQPIFGHCWTSLCNMWYNDEYRLAREIVDLDLFFAKHIMDGVVTERRGTHSSGNYATVWANTISNIITVIYAIVLVMRGTDDVDDPRTVRSFVATIFRKCDAIFVGDDFLFSVPDDMKELINFHTLREGMEMIGYKITSPHKDGRADENFVDFHEATFLKRRFKQTEYGEWYAPLEMESIINQINWVNKRNFARKDFILTIESYCHELSLHGEEEFEWRFVKLKEACTSNFDYVPKYSTCEEYFKDRRNALLLLEETEDVDIIIQNFGGSTIRAPTKSKKKTKDEETVHYGNLVKTFEEQCLVTSTSLYGSPVVEIRDSDYNVVSPTKIQKKQKSHSFSGGGEYLLECSTKTRGSCERPKSCKGNTKIYLTQMATTKDTTTTTQIKQNEQSSVSIEQGTTNLNISSQEGFAPEKEKQPLNLSDKPISQDQVSDFFKKKVEVSTVQWSTGVGTMTVLDTIYISNQLFSQAIWSNKLSGFLNFRATAVLTVQINATPFHQGALYLVWKPYVDNDNDFGVYDQMHATHMINLSQLPGHLMTISSDSIEVRIPYIGPVEYIRRDSANKWNWGALAIYVYAPLKTASSDSVVVKTWLSFDDIKIETPYFTQMNVSKVKANTASENEDVGLVSSTMKTLKRIVDKQEARVLEMTALCMPPTWVLEDGANNAKAMGWSKPNNSCELTRMVRNLYFFGPNSDGQDISQSLSLRADNKIQLLPSLGPFEGDEMAIDYIVSKWSYLRTFTFSTSQAPGDGLYNVEHRPSGLTSTTELSTGPTTSKTMYNMTPPCFIAQYFDQWRGDLEFKFVFVKTGFHSGAISVTYLPGADSSTFNYANAPYNLRTIMDLQESEEFCFRVPYCVPDPFTPWLEKAGHVHVHCVTPLKAPSTVAQSIDILVYVRGADNLTYQVPRYSGPKATYYTQGADVSNDGCIEEDVLGNGNVANTRNAFEALCVGEKIVSLKQLMLRMEKVGVSSSASGIFQAKIKPNSTNVFAWQRVGIPAYYQRVATTSLNCTFIDTIMCCYLFQRGSTRWAIYCANNYFYSTMKTAIDWGTSTADFRTDRWLSSTSSVSDTGPSIFASDHNAGGLIVRAPYYSRYPVSMIRPTWNNTQSPTGRWDTSHYIDIEAQNSWNVADNSTTFSRSVGDDYQLGFFIGVPVLSYV